MIRLPARSACAALILALCACSGPTPDAASTDPGARAGATSPGRLVIVGGALDADNAQVYQAIAEGREGDGPLCVVPTASGVPESSMGAAVRTLADYVGDSAAVGVLLAESNASEARDPAMAARLAACSGYFFTGGDQSRVVDTFLPDGDTTAAFRAVRRRWEQGAVLSGSSAGAAMMSGVMIASGSSTGAVEHGVADSERDDGAVWIRRGMGFFTGAILDQHFLARGRIGRLLVATLVTDSLPLGLGIDENTALVVDGDTASVLGASGVVLVDARRVVDASRGFGRGVRVSLAGTGDRIDLRTFRVTRGEGKAPLAIAEPHGVQPEDPFARWGFLHLIAGLAGSTETEAVFQVPGAVLSVRQGVGFSAAAEPGAGVQGEPRGLSAGPFLVDLVASPTR